MKNKAIFLLGPTAVGKTELSLSLAAAYNLEIISVDSALIYQGLNIGSAKPTAAELAQVPHHLIDIVSPLANYSVAEFLHDCNQAITEINQRGKIALVVGGTMMYYNALINGLAELPAANPELRATLESKLRLDGASVLHQQLQSLDPQAAARIAVNDRQRLLRALELCLSTGLSLAQLHTQYHRPGLVNCEYLALAIIPANRTLLQQRINQRLLNMLSCGFIDEVVGLRAAFPELTAAHNSMRTVGYRQVWQYLAGEYSYPELCEKAQAATRQLAKRQLTWLRSLPVISIDDSELQLTSLYRQIQDQITYFV